MPWNKRVMRLKKMNLKIHLFTPWEKALSSKWIFFIKYKAVGPFNVTKPFVVLGNTQTKCIDFIETFAHVAKMATFSYSVAFCYCTKLVLHQMDVHNIFFYNELRGGLYATTTWVSFYFFWLSLSTKELLIWYLAGSLVLVLQTHYSITFT